MRESGVYSDQKKAEVAFDALFRNSKGRIVEPPVLTQGAPVADTHCHLDMLQYPELALARAAVHGVDFIVAVTDPTEDSAFTYRELPHWQAAARKLLASWNAELPAGQRRGEEPPRVRVLIGCHPHNATKYTSELEQSMVTLAEHPITCGIGEIGLDYHYDHSPRDVQREVFARQLALATERDLPVVLHLREAHADGLAILREAGPFNAGMLLHCYNLDYATLEPFLELGCHVAYGGPLTFKKSDEVRDGAIRVPLTRLVTETDAPYMTPEPLRGTVCGPEHTIFTAARLAELRLVAASVPDVEYKAEHIAERISGQAAEQAAEHAAEHAAECAAGQISESEAIALLNTLYETARRLLDRDYE